MALFTEVRRTDLRTYTTASGTMYRIMTRPDGTQSILGDDSGTRYPDSDSVEAACLADERLQFAQMRQQRMIADALCPLPAGVHLTTGPNGEWWTR
jgi:hypothetical protein